jgi:hypothetical protein
MNDTKNALRWPANTCSGIPRCTRHLAARVASQCTRGDNLSSNRLKCRRDPHPVRFAAVCISSPQMTCKIWYDENCAIYDNGCTRPFEKQAGSQMTREGERKPDLQIVVSRVITLAFLLTRAKRSITVALR